MGLATFLNTDGEEVLVNPQRVTYSYQSTNKEEVVIKFGKDDSVTVQGDLDRVRQELRLNY
ncbi:hypothetical protein [Chromobacterium sphagni]|nr:hypothetical protein [Chromobacterium sphagni]